MLDEKQEKILSDEATSFFDIDDAKFEDVFRQSKKFIESMSCYKCAMMEIETKFNVLNEEFSLQYDRQPISSIKKRLKNPISIKNKMVSRNIPLTVEDMEENLNDIAGVRVICSFLDDVYMIADSLLKQDDIQLIEMKDYITKPKKNGYRSLHLIVAVPIFLAHEKRIIKAEIQLRTIAMDFWATLEHQLRYKKDNEFTEQMANELHECARISADLDRRMNKLGNKYLEDTSINF